MKSLKSIHYLICSLLLLLILSVGCDTSESTDGGGLAGTWQLTSMSMTYLGMTIQIPQEDMMQQTLTINEDGTFTASGIDDDGPFTESGTWNTNGNVLTVYSPMDGTMTFNYSISGNTLTLTGDMVESGETISVTMTYTRV
ncbi:lipocalin family protein [Bacteroidota bacterium]